MSDKVFDSNWEEMPLAQLNDYEKERLPLQLEYVIRNSAFYQNKLRDAGFKANIENLSIEKFPFTEKYELLNDQTQHPPFGNNLTVARSMVKRVHRTSGTTSQPLFIALTENDIKNTVQTGARCFWSSGLRPGDMVVHCLNYCLWMGGYTDHQSLEATGAAVVPFGTGNSQMLIDTIINLNVNAIHCTPSYLSKLEVLLGENKGRKPVELGLKKGFFGGESGIQNKLFREEIEKKWGMKAMNANYGMSDVLSMFGAECRERDGLHFMGQGNVMVELINPITLEFIPILKGSTGELVLTNLTKEAQPVIRFRTRDIIEIINNEKCKCGRTSFRFNVVGRSDDMLVIKGVNLFPNSISEVLNDFVGEVNGEFQIILHSSPPLETFDVRIEYKDMLSLEDIGILKKKIRDIIKTKLFVSPEIIMVKEGSLPRTEGKTQRIFKQY